MRNPLIAIALVAALPAVLSAAPQPDKNLTTQTLWQQGEGGYELYRIPGIVVSHKGTILAYSVGRRTVAQGDWGDSDIFLRRSTDGGHTFLPSQHIAGDGHGVTDNPVAIATREGDVHMIYQHGYARVFAMVSHDEGRTFSDPIDITAALEDLRSQFDWSVVAMGPGHAIEMKNGRLLVPVWLADSKPKPDGTRPHAPSAITTLYSDDHGRTWHHGDLIARSQPSSQPSMINPNENQDIQLADGSIMANVRLGDPTQRRAVTISPDGIHQWSPLTYDQNLYDPICEGSIVRYSEKPKDPRNIILFSNPDSENTPGPTKDRGFRRNLTVRMSLDEGKTWPIQRVLDPGTAGYSDLAVAPDKTIYDIYETPLGDNKKQHSVVITRFSLNWLASGKPLP